jgi:hypothetical protein
MAYSINKTDGTILATVADGTIDTLSSDITLIGKNYSGFGESINENFIKILENFSSTSAPVQPIRGQIWFDASELKLKVYTGTAFVPVSSATISSTQPINLGVGDLWFNDVDKQLFFYDGISTILLGPDYTASQGISGLIVVNILDSLNQNRVVTYLYTNGILLGIFSKDEFTPKSPIEGFSGSIIPGFNAGNLPGLKFNVTATNAERLGNQPASAYVRSDTSNIINGQVIISSNLGLIIGDANQGQIQVENGNLIVTNIASDKGFELRLRRGVLSEKAVQIDSPSRTIDFYKDYNDSLVNFAGSVIIGGDLTVNGEMTTVSSSNLIVEDKNIELGATAIPTDATADGGGITLKGTNDHSIIWNDSSKAWSFSEHINLYTSDSVANPEFKINGVTVLSATSLGPNITSAPGLTSFGSFSDFTVDDFFFDENVLEITPGENLEISLSGGGTLDLGNSKITNVAAPAASNDAANKQYVDNTVRSRNLAFTLDISDGPSTLTNSQIASILSQMAPVNEYNTGTLARILCVTYANGTSSVSITPTLTKDFFNAPSGLLEGVTDVAIGTVVLPAQTLTVASRILKTYRLEPGSPENIWTFLTQSAVSI